jgi:hypothetical protein
MMHIQRFPTNPIIRPEMDARIGHNINGPSLIHVPDWIANPLGRYYLYFAHHQGTFIRLAYADELAGPWTVFTPGVLDLSASHFPIDTGPAYSHHIASPDVHVLAERREIRMYYHGCCYRNQAISQVTRLAISSDGLHFRARADILGASYWRVFTWQGFYYALVMPGVFMRSRDGVTDFETGPTLFSPAMRHSAVKRQGDMLLVFYSNAGDCPERILLSRIQLTPDWHDWRATPAETVLAPELDYEGVKLPLIPSQRGAVHEPARQLRDPAIFEEAGRTYLLYSVAGEQGIAIAEINL